MTIAGLKQGDEVEIPFGKWKGYLGNFKTDKLMKEIR